MNGSGDGPARPSASATAPPVAGGGCDPARIGSGRHEPPASSPSISTQTTSRFSLPSRSGSPWSSGCCWRSCWVCGWCTSVIASRARPAHPPVHGRGRHRRTRHPVGHCGLPRGRRGAPGGVGESAGPCLSCRSCGTGRPRRPGSPLSSPPPPRASPCWEPSWRSATAPVGWSAPRPPRWFSGSPSTSSPPPGSTYANWSPGTATTGSLAARWPSAALAAGHVTQAAATLGQLQSAAPGPHHRHAGALVPGHGVAPPAGRLRDPQAPARLRRAPLGHRLSLGMYAACSFITGEVAGIAAITDFGHAWTWVAFTAGCSRSPGSYVTAGRCCAVSRERRRCCAGDWCSASARSRRTSGTCSRRSRSRTGRTTTERVLTVLTYLSTRS